MVKQTKIMEQITSSNYRVGRFSSSSIHLLMRKGRGKDQYFGAPALTYIAEKNLEWKLGRSLATDVYSPAIYWGYLMERIVHNILPDEYKLISTAWNEMKDDEFKNYWCGTADMEVKGEMISEIKCYQLKKFGEYAEMLMQQSVDLFKKDYPQEYWQIVSNSIIYGVDIGEAVAYMPYKEELEQIRDDVENTNLLEVYKFQPWQYRFLTERAIGGLPYIRKGGYFKNITKFTFLVPEEDKELLKERVREAMKLLIKYQ